MRSHDLNLRSNNFTLNNFNFNLRSNASNFQEPSTGPTWRRSSSCSFCSCYSWGYSCWIWRQRLKPNLKSASLPISNLKSANLWRINNSANWRIGTFWKCMFDIHPHIIRFTRLTVPGYHQEFMWLKVLKCDFICCCIKDRKEVVIWRKNYCCFGVNVGGNVNCTDQIYFLFVQQSCNIFCSATSEKSYWETEWKCQRQAKYIWSKNRSILSGHVVSRQTWNLALASLAAPV